MSRSRTTSPAGPKVARLADLRLPVFAMPDVEPMLPAAIHAGRLERLRERMAGAGFSHLAIYADREHSANLAWLTGFDPRFEEALLLVAPTGKPRLLVGNECWGVAAHTPLPVERELYQDFSLPGQPRNRSRSLAEILKDVGIRRGSKVGAVGWKTLADALALDVPAYLADALRKTAGGRGTVGNASGLFIDAADGLRVVNEAEALVAMEAASCRTSQGVRRLIFGLEPGLTEHEAVRLLDWNGAPLSCHLMLTAGPRATIGLLSPSDRPIQRGDRFTVAFGIWGALNCRAGFVVADAPELPVGAEGYVEKLVGPYFAAIAEWYEALHIGQSAAALTAIIERRLGDPSFGLFINPGHQIGLDEWVNSPFAADSKVELRSGMAFQVDVIPATGSDLFTTNIEDGIALADSALRADLAARWPEAWARMQARRAFMQDALGIDLHPDVLPFSNIPAYLPPFLLRPDRAMTVA